MMDQPYVYKIRVEGCLSNRRIDWFEGLTIRNTRCGETILNGVLDDPAALYGILNKIQGLNLTLISVNRVLTHDHATGQRYRNCDGPA